MNWGYFFLWVAAIFVLFFVTGWPVSPHFTSVWGNQYEAKNLTYFAVLYIHYLLGPLVFTFLGLGLFRNLIWTNSPRQLVFLLAYSVLVASAIAVYIAHRYAPEDNTTKEQDPVLDESDAMDDNMNMTDTNGAP